jgi:uncharacterized protein (DUF2252 family)
MIGCVHERGTMPAVVESRTPQERARHGKAARAEVPRGSHAGWEAGPGRRAIVEQLEEQAATRVGELVPVRYGRMLASPFAYFRGAAAVMAADLAGTPASGIDVQLCGDAHLSNFGGFASPERDLIFDINDFDETMPGPWEWDVKRLATSIEIAGRDLGFKRAARHGAAHETVRSYREAMRRFAAMPNLDVWYAKLDAGAILEAAGRRVDGRARATFSARADKARTKDSVAALAKLTHTVNGEPRIVSDPPVIVPIEELLPGADGERLDEQLRTLLARYTETLRSDRRALLDGYRPMHLARKVVGVGSVGTRAWIVLLLGRDAQDPLFLQVKEAEASVLEPFVERAPQHNHGQRVVEGQWLMQAASDILLGWLHADGIDGRERDFYVRQLWDWKVSADIEQMRPGVMSVYGQLCGWTLARAHARSGNRIAIAAYLGSGDSFDRAVTEFADAYADQNELDYRALADAAGTGAISARTDL